MSEFLKSVEKSYGRGSSHKNEETESGVFRIEDLKTAGEVDDYDDRLFTCENYFDIANSAGDIPLLGSLSKANDCLSNRHPAQRKAQVVNL